MCDRALWLEHGVAKMVGESSEVIDGYLGARTPRAERGPVDRGLGIRRSA